MRALIAAILLTPALALAGTSQQAIINGEAIDSDEFPSALQIILQGASQLTGGATVAQPSCTGVLIAPDVVLTAAHCVDPLPLTLGFVEAEWYTFWISFDEDHSDMIGGTSQPSEPPDGAIEAAGWEDHPDFDMANFEDSGGELSKIDDIALIFLSEAVTDVPFSYLPDASEADEIEVDLTVDIVGYGQRDVGSGNPFEPPEPGSVGVRYWTETFINQTHEYELQIGDGPETGRKCHGDSGGPTYAMIGSRGDDLERVIGITSHALNAEEDCNVGGVDTRVDAYIDWIDETMRAACDDGTRVDCANEGLPDPGEAIGDDDDAAADDDNDGGRGGDGCSSCSTATSGSPGWLALGLLALLRRRR
jgi:MYXO-CTERM domain-containing protein